jgi:hypothetical protein
MEFDNGYVTVKLVGEKDKYGNESSTTGKYLLSRACSEDNYAVWNEVLKFALHG